MIVPKDLSPAPMQALNGAGYDRGHVVTVELDVDGDFTGEVSEAELIAMGRQVLDIADRERAYM